MFIFQKVQFFFKNVKKIEKINIDFEKLINLFEIKKG